MSVYKWYVPTLSEIIALGEQAAGRFAGQDWESLLPESEQRRLWAERQWYGAIAAFNALLAMLQQDTATDSSAPASMVLSGPTPVLQGALDGIRSWTFTTEMDWADWLPLHLLPAADATAIPTPAATLPLLPHDPLTDEQFCLALTPTFGLVMTLGKDANGEPVFLFSFVPEVVWQAWRSLRSRLVLSAPHAVPHLDLLAERLTAVEPSYQLVMQFQRLMLLHLAPEQELPREGAQGQSADATVTLGSAATLSGKTATKVAPPSDHQPEPETIAQPDVDILRAIAHEVRTPLTTIRTLTRLLMRRKDITPDVSKRLAMIDRECTQQIDRFSLIFRAVELETAAAKPCAKSLASTSLTQVFQDGIPQWQDKAMQRNLTLDVRMPSTLPMVVSDPVMLHQMLGGLIDRVTHTLPSGSHIQLHVSLAGSQLKLQLRSRPDETRSTVPAPSFFAPTLQAIGHLLMFQPETGNLSLNLDVTKNLFQALGGKLIVRHRPHHGEVVTIFLPLETKSEA